jgi:hypothetical protein
MTAKWTLGTDTSRILHLIFIFTSVGAKCYIMHFTTSSTLIWYLLSSASCKEETCSFRKHRSNMYYRMLKIQVTEHFAKSGIKWKGTKIIYVLKLLQQLNLMKSSQAISHIRCLYETDISRTISVIIIRDLISNPWWWWWWWWWRRWPSGPWDISFIQTPGTADSVRRLHQRKKLLTFTYLKRWREKNLTYVLIFTHLCKNRLLNLWL